ncbi:MAG: plastocyanin [Actinobacteria bacterium]|nr:plastocyanin [Actinomycetota bacterium]
MIAGIALAACENQGGEGAGEAHVPMLDNFFARHVTRIPVGGEVVFVNDGDNPHNAVALDGSWETQAELVDGESETLTIDEPGVYRYYCTFHGTAAGDGMAAVLVVGDVEYDAEGGSDEEAVAEASGRILLVQGDAPAPDLEPSGSDPDPFGTIQDAVDEAEPGDMVLIDEGVYEEEVVVDTPSLTIRGVDRNEVVLDGNFEMSNGIQVVADGVAIENMTARHYILNGFFWTGVEGYRASYVTAYNNADYGVYAFDSVDGVIEHSYASGGPDSAFYIGQCYPCDAVINDVIAEHSALGYSGTNAGGNLYIVDSLWVNNRAGIVPNTLDTELLPPQREVSIVGNLVIGNDNPEPVIKGGSYAAFGNGILLAGGRDNLVERNVVLDHANHGILASPNIDKNFWFASGNKIRDNLIGGSGRADLALAGPGSIGNCFGGNDHESSAPFALELLHGCGGLRLPLGFDLLTASRTLGYYAAAPDGFELRTVGDQPVPPDQEQMPGGEDAAVQPAADVFENYDLDIDAIAPPDPSVALEAPLAQEVTLVTEVGSPGVFQILFGLYGYLMPFVLLAAWVSLSLWDIARRDELARATGIGWVGAILLVPFVGVIAYLAVGGSRLPGWMRLVLVAGGLAAYLVILGLGALVGGIV